MRDGLGRNWTAVPAGIVTDKGLGKAGEFLEKVKEVEKLREAAELAKKEEELRRKKEAAARLEEAREKAAKLAQEGKTGAATPGNGSNSQRPHETAANASGAGEIPNEKPDVTDEKLVVASNGPVRENSDTVAARVRRDMNESRGSSSGNGSNTGNGGNKSGGDGTPSSSGVPNALPKIVPASYFEDVARQATRNPDSDKLVLGHFSGDSVSYQKVAAHYKATYFKVDDWNAVTKGLTKEEVWKINRAFLTQQVKQGKQIIFSHNPLEAKPNSFFEREVNFLRDLGYKFKQKDQWTWEAFR